MPQRRYHARATGRTIPRAASIGAPGSWASRCSLATHDASSLWKAWRSRASPASLRAPTQWKIPTGVTKRAAWVP